MNSKLGRQHTKAPLAATPTHDVNDVMCCVKIDNTTGSTSPTLFEERCGFFYVPQEPGMCKCCATDIQYSFRPYPRRLERLIICKCHYKGSTFFSVI